MERHRANPEERIQCPDCDKTYPTRRYMLSHYRTIHLNKRRKRGASEKPFDANCEVCGKRFQNAHNLRQHVVVSIGLGELIAGILIFDGLRLEQFQKETVRIKVSKLHTICWCFTMVKCM